MSHATELDRVWQIIEKVGVCMFTTRFGGGLRARPLEARPDRKSDCLLFVTDVSSAKRDEVDRWPEVGLVFIDAADKAYLSITGKAQIADDPDLRAAAWRKNDVVWWPGGPNERRETLTTVFVAVIRFSLLAVAVTFMVTTWQRSDAQMSVHGWIALGLGVFFSLLIGCGLMALMFFSSRRGYDEQPKHSDYDRAPK